MSFLPTHFFSVPSSEVTRDRAKSKKISYLSFSCEMHSDAAALCTLHHPIKAEFRIHLEALKEGDAGWNTE